MNTMLAMIKMSKSSKFSDEEYMIQFWKPKITELILKVYDGKFVSKSEIIKDFTLHFAKPFGLENIIDELLKRKDIVTVNSIIDRSYFKPAESKGFFKSFTSWFYKED